MKTNKNFIWGILFIIIGTILALNSLKITNINLFFEGWWTLFIIIPSLIDLFNDEDKTGSIIGLLIGILLLLSIQGYFRFEIIWKLLFPSILIIIGLSLIFKNNRHQKHLKKIKTNPEQKEHFTAFAGKDIVLDNEEFSGCNLTAVFGGIKLDLRNSIIKEDIAINAFAIFGGIDIITPEDVQVKITSTPIFGGISNKRKNNQTKEAKTIYINAICIFGGTDIK